MKVKRKLIFTNEESFKMALQCRSDTKMNGTNNHLSRMLDKNNKTAIETNRNNIERVREEMRK